MKTGRMLSDHHICRDMGVYIEDTKKLKVENVMEER